MTSLVLVGMFWLGDYDLKGVLKGQFPSLRGDIDHSRPSSETESIVPSSESEGTIDYSGPLRQTTIPNNANIHGFTIFEDLYLRNGTLYIVTDNPDSFPPLRHILSQPNQAKAGSALEPTDNEMQVISLAKAKTLLGERALRLDGFTVLLYEPKQFMTHYYHFWGEAILGLWRIYSKLGIREDGTIAPLPSPARFIAPFVDESGWRDRPSLNGPLLRAAFPTAAIENAHYWRDLVELESTVVFSRVIVVNRVAAHRHPFGGVWYKMISGTMNVTVPEGFWEPIRHSVLNNILGYIPNVDAVSSKPVVTYIARWSRTLIDSHHQALVRGLETLEAEGICEVNVVRMEDMVLKQQIELAARTTIMLGVHGNGLTHQLWMTPSDKSTVIEIFIPTGFTFDYEILARNLGHRHYAIWNDTALTYPKGTTHKGIKYPPGFHGKTIPVHVETVTRIIRERLVGSRSVISRNSRRYLLATSEQDEP